jgi:glycosyltransferase involved in cell wall biosynthesis
LTSVQPAPDLPRRERPTIVCFSSIDWDFNWQIPQEVMSGLAADGCRVLCVENTGIRPPGFADASRLGARLRTWWHARGRVRPLGDRLDAFAPVILPFPYSRAACRVNAALLVRMIRQWIGERPSGPLVLLTFLPTPLVRAVAGALSPALVVYYCADRLAESSPAARPLVPHEEALIGSADLVFASSTALLRYVSQFTSRATLLTSGVRFDLFRAGRARRRASSPIGDQKRPVAGFVGSLRNELDLALLARAVRLAPDVTFVLAGPVYADVDVLRALPNVVLPGAVSHADAVDLMCGFDAGLMPYALNDYTAHLLPVKLKEYLAAGLPIVSTPLPEVQAFLAQHGPVATVVEGAESFADAVRRETRVTPPDLQRRLAVAAQYDWSERLAAMTQAISRALAARSSRGVPA